MNKQAVTNLIKVISKSTDKNSIYKALVKLRTDLVKDKQGVALLLEVDGSIGSLVRLISKPYEKILEVALSILGNACTLKECSKQVPQLIIQFTSVIFISYVHLYSGNITWCCANSIDHSKKYS